jgi:phosphoglycolate phosphatase
MPRFQHIIFDLDGTLIDSAPAILDSFRHAFADAGIQPVRPIDAAIIGPPLRETLALLCGDEHAAAVDTLAARFAARYDSTGYRATEAYAGVDAMLRSLRALGCNLHIATNKRIGPTRSILAHLGWEALFANVYALDLFQPRLADKATMIARLMADRNIAPAAASYVGDREEDGLSADANGLPFFAATWGYGSLSPSELRSGWAPLNSPANLCDAVC